MNCWEFKKCGREPGGVNVSNLGLCPASVNEELSGVHGGKNGGRCCWMLSGDFSCGTDKSKSLTEKIERCRQCDFYQSLMKSTELIVQL